MFSQIPFLFFYFLFSTSELWLSHTCKREMGERERNVRQFHTVKYVSEYIQVFLKHFFLFLVFFSLRAGLQLKLYAVMLRFFIIPAPFGKREWVVCALAYLPFQEALAIFLFLVLINTLYLLRESFDGEKGSFRGRG